MMGQSVRSAWDLRWGRRMLLGIALASLAFWGAVPSVSHAAPDDEGTAGGAAGEIAESADADVGAEVARILDKFRAVKTYRHANADVQHIISLGPKAVPALLGVIGEKARFGQGWARRLAASEALAQLASADHVPALRKLALSGSGGAIVVLGGVRDPSALDALLACVAADQMSWELEKALAPHMADPRVASAVVAWFESHLTTGDWQVAAAASLLGASDDPSVVDPLLRALPHATEPQTVKRLGVALIGHERKEGVDALVALVGRAPVNAGRSALTYYFEAARELNDVVDRTLFEGNFERGPSADEENAAALARSAPLFQEWWTEARETFEFVSRGRPVEARKPRGALVVVTDGGEPTEGATVRILGTAGSTARGNWLPSDRAVATSAADGLARFAMNSAPICLLASKDDRSAFLCNHVGSDEPIHMQLGPGTSVHGVLVGPAGEPLVEPRLRIQFPGGYEWHHLDVTVAEDGGFRFAPLPTTRVQSGSMYLEIRAENAPSTRVELDDRTVYPMRVEIQPPRPIRGRVVGIDGRDVRAARIFFGDPMDGDEVRVPGGGVFEIPMMPGGVRQLLFLSESHAARVLMLPAGTGPVDLGDVELRAGRALGGSVRESDRRPIERAFLALSLADGTRVGTSGLSSDGSFEFPHVGRGPHNLHVYVHRVRDGASWRLVTSRVEADGKTVQVVVPQGVTLRLIDDQGQAYRAETVRVELRFESGDSYTETFSGGPSRSAFSEIRLRRFPAEDFVAVVIVDGREPITTKRVQTDERGAAIVEISVR